MDLKSAKESLSQLKGAIAVEESEKPGYALEASFDVGGVAALAEELLKNGFFIENLTASDFEDGQAIYYSFNRFEKPLRIVARVQIEIGREVPSISHVYAGASWYEREIFELFEITFRDHGDLRRLLLPEDADFFPLKKSFGKVAAVRKLEDIYD